MLMNRVSASQLDVDSMRSKLLNYVTLVGERLRGVDDEIKVNTQFAWNTDDIVETKNINGCNAHALCFCDLCCMRIWIWICFLYVMWHIIREVMCFFLHDEEDDGEDA